MSIKYEIPWNKSGSPGNPEIPGIVHPDKGELAERKTVVTERTKSYGALTFSSKERMVIIH